MVREDILGILKTALQKGKNLQQAAQSLINAGYPENEVNEASRSVESYVFQPTQIQKPVRPAPVQNPPQFVPGQSPQIVSDYYSPSPVEYVQQPQQRVVQRVSGYSVEGDRAGKAVTIIMVIILAILIGILVMVFMFKEEIMSILNNL